MNIPKDSCQNCTNDWNYTFRKAFGWTPKKATTTREHMGKTLHLCDHCAKSVDAIHNYKARRAYA